MTFPSLPALFGALPKAGVRAQLHVRTLHYYSYMHPDRAHVKLLHDPTFDKGGTFMPEATRRMIAAIVSALRDRSRSRRL